MSSALAFKAQGMSYTSFFDTKFTFEAKYGSKTTKIEKIIKNTRLK